jgi:hypothetical protein
MLQIPDECFSATGLVSLSGVLGNSGGADRTGIMTGKRGKRREYFPAPNNSALAGVGYFVTGCSALRWEIMLSIKP